MRTAAFVLPVVAVIGLVDVGPAPAQAPACDAATSGTTACFVRKLCVCQYQVGGSLTAEPAGYRWNCDELRPACDLDQGGAEAGSPTPWPADGVTIDVPWPRERAPHPLRSYEP